MPVRNEAAFIRRSLGAVLAQDYPAERMEIIVADGQSSDQTREIIREIAGESARDVTLIENPDRIVATGLNAAVRLAQGEIVLRVDGHCEIRSDYVTRCVAKLTQNDYAGVGGIVETVGETYTSRAIAAAMASRFGVGGSAFRLGVVSERCSDTVPFPAYRRETLQLAGQFDEELVRNQDDEYNYRIRKLGGRLALCPDIRSRYYSRATLKNLWSQYWQYGFWKVRVLQKHPRQMQPRQFMPAMLVAAFFTLLITAPVFQVSALLLAALAATYGGCNIVAAIMTARRTGWQLLPLISAAFAILHFSYGSGFLFGLIRFFKRWEFSGRATVAPPSSDPATL
jgi:glycosyltransferase involved in cell wall biosynthesis